jgi:hypothetical protein
VQEIYIDDTECNEDDFKVFFEFYGTKTICNEHGVVKYKTCDSESLGTEIMGFEPILM